MRQDAARQFIGFIAENLNAAPDCIVKTYRGGRKPRTWAHWQIALAYGKYLNHRLHAEINAVYRAYKEAKTQRQVSIEQRKEYSSVLASRGVERGNPNGFAICTNAGYCAVCDLDADGLRKKHGLAARANVRAAMSRLLIER